jgi:hypothetical protein
MEIRAKSRLDDDSVKALTHVWMFKKADPKKRMILWTIAAVVLFSIILLEIFLFDADILLFVLLGVTVAIYLWECYLHFLLPRIRYNSLGTTILKNRNARKTELLQTAGRCEVSSGRADDLAR